ncbi:MAG: tRNA(Met) cytidine acetyltransferase TmcA [Candidatus Njordarchaeales archaeon]
MDPWKRFLIMYEKKESEERELSSTQFNQLITKALRNAYKTNHRRLFVLAGTDYIKSIKKAAKILEKMIRLFQTKNMEVLYVGYEPKDLPEKLHFEVLEKELKGLPIKLEKMPFALSTLAMGRTYDAVIIDFTQDVPPNDIGRLVETVRGGGIVIFITPPIPKWAELKTAFHRYITTIPWKLEDVPGRFIKRIIKKLFEHDGIYVFDLDKNLVLKAPDESTFARKIERKKPDIPSDTRLPKAIYRVALTQDQVKALKALEFLMERPKEGYVKTVILTADRGRGKSAAVGLFLGCAAKTFAGRGAFGRFMIIVTAPTEYNVYTLFEFAEKALKLLGESPRVYRRPPEIRGRGYVIVYVPPAEAPKIAKREKAEIVAVDEAAGIPVPVLLKILESSPRVIYSSTIHGYEGAGRGFSVRFLKNVKERKDISLLHVELEEPIRYAPNDPIEKWLFDTLLLDAEPVKLDEKDYEDIEKLNVSLEKADLDEWLLGDKEALLRDFIGIYVFAHYRNEPKDLAIMADAPHYEAYFLKTSTGKIVTALLVAKEGGLPKAVIWEVYKNKAAEPSGHLIPIAIEKHFRSTTFPQLMGYRIVRIATHPEVMRKGLGSKAIEELAKIAIRNNMAWIGAGFGASEELVKFWLKNKFVPVHVSPMRHRVSGEYTTIVIRPLKKDLEPLVREYYREFRIRFVEWLRYVHYDMEPRLARLLLKGGYIWERVEKPFHYEPRLTEIQKKRIVAYQLGILSYELVSDAIQELVKAYFIDEDPQKPELDELSELLLICRVLQARTWAQTFDLLDLDISKKKATRQFGIAVNTLYKYFVKERERREEIKRLGIREIEISEGWQEGRVTETEEDFEKAI